MKDISYLPLSTENPVRESYMGIHKYHTIKSVMLLKIIAEMCGGEHLGS